MQKIKEDLVAGEYTYEMDGEGRVRLHLPHPQPHRVDSMPTKKEDPNLAPDPLEELKEELKSFVGSLTLEGAKVQHYGTNVNINGPDGLEWDIVSEVVAGGSKFKDAEYIPLEVRVTVSETTFVTATPKESIARFQFGLKVAQLAQSIVDHFKGQNYRFLLQSREDKLKELVWAFCAGDTKGMLRGQTVIKRLERPTQFLSREYSYEVDKKSYNVTVSLEMNGLLLSRTK